MIGDVNLDSFMVSHMEHIAREAGKRLVVELPNDSQVTLLHVSRARTVY